MITIEKNIPFSKSIMWSDQKKYYNEKGIKAWDDDVPFYITSNPFIAKSYAEMAISFMQDWILKNPSAKNDIFYILELGTGTGQFSFYFLKSFLQLQQLLKLESIKICYVMSDISANSFEFWGNHAGLEPFLEKGMLDFSVYDMYRSENIELYRSQKIISEKTIKNPLMVIANYLFDSIATDVFTVRDKKLFESTVTIETDEKNTDNGFPKDWQKTKITYQEHEIKDHYYGNELDAVLFDYKNTLMESHFQFPISGLIALQRLQKIGNGKMLLLSSDKGYSNLEELDHCDYPELDFHGSFSVMVNYHAIAELLKKSQGDAVIQSFREHITTGVFSSGFTLENFPQLQLAISHMIYGFSPTDYFIIYEHFIEHYKKSSLEVMASYLNLSHWDPYLFDHISEHLCELAEEGDPDVVSFLAKNMSKIADNVFCLATSEDTYFSIGVFFQNIGRFEEAITYYEKSLIFFGDSDVALFNMGMCYYSLDRNEKAVELLERAHAFNADSKDAKEWISVIQNEK